MKSRNWREGVYFDRLFYKNAKKLPRTRRQKKLEQYPHDPKHF